MFKMKIPYSVFVLAVALIAGAPIWLAALLGGAIEFIGAVALLAKLCGTSEFKYHSFYGLILRQFTILDEVGIGNIWLIVSVRLVAFLFIGMALWYVGAILLLLSCSHYIVN